MAGYWAGRKNLDYYQIVRTILEGFGPMGSVLDVGSWDTPIATYGDFDERITVDPRPRPALMGVLPIVGRWPDCSHLVPVCDVVLCLQVLEHLDDPEPFCAALFAHARHAVVISVPWGWPAGQEPSHRQDPVGAAKVRQWTGRDPVTCRITPSPGARAVMVYSA